MTTFSTLPALGSASRAEGAARLLGDAIMLGLIGEGEQLPAEAELAAQLGVATVTLREALATLRQQGLIETRRGRGGGSFVRQPRTISLRSMQAHLGGLSADELRDIADHRAAVSGASAAVAAERASRFEINRLRQQVSAVAAATTLAGRRRADSRFHIELAAIGHSPRLTRAEIALQAEIGELLLLILDDSSERERMAVEHEAILKAVTARQSDRARRLTETHVAADSARLTELYLGLVAGEAE